MRGMHFRELHRLDHYDGYDRRYIENWWCIEIGDSKHHVHGKVVMDPKKGYVLGQVVVEPCDGSCERLSDIPKDIWEEACPHLGIDLNGHISQYLLPFPPREPVPI